MAFSAIIAEIGIDMYIERIDEMTKRKRKFLED